MKGVRGGKLKGNKGGAVRSTTWRIVFRREWWWSLWLILSLKEILTSMLTEVLLAIQIVVVWLCGSKKFHLVHAQIDPLECRKCSPAIVRKIGLVFAV
ncbi:MAG: hypothetical protein ACI8X5_001960 [Planctomycetota bacterium]|jgi:hypothetical protein